MQKWWRCEELYKRMDQDVLNLDEDVMKMWSRCENLYKDMGQDVMKMWPRCGVTDDRKKNHNKNSSHREISQLRILNKWEGITQQ